MRFQERDPDFERRVRASFARQAAMRLLSVTLEHFAPGEVELALPFRAARRTIRMIAGHLHNARCTWIKTLGQEHGIAVPASV